MPNNPSELPPIEGELTDEELKQVSGGVGSIANFSGFPVPAGFIVVPGQGPNTVDHPNPPG
jgi:lactobin A/cerein 7B family class IIb bacteriocin